MAVAVDLPPSRGGHDLGRIESKLIEAVRGGAVEEYGRLYERHVTAAYDVARRLARSAAEADDLVSEAFAKVLDALRVGGGPDSAFRAYLLTTLRHTAYENARQGKKITLSDDVTAVVDGAAASVPFRDPVVVELDRTLAVRAFARLSERWQAVLWHTEIEGRPPAEVAPLFGLTPNGVSSLRCRARERLRQAYLVEGVTLRPNGGRCVRIRDLLGAWTRAGLRPRRAAQVADHLAGCPECRRVAVELGETNTSLPAHGRG